MNITAKQFVAMIQEQVKGTSMVTVDQITVPDMRKTGNPYLTVKKHATVNGVIGFDYDKGINRLADKEGKEDREAKPRRWGQLTPDRLFVTNKGNFYLQMKCESAKNVRYVMPNGTEIPVEQIKPFLTEKSKSSSQADLEGEVVVRDVNVNNIVAIRFKGNEYRLIHTPIIEAETTDAEMAMV